MVGLIISAIVVGLIIGALGRVVLPGRQDIRIWLTILIGIIATLIGRSSPATGRTFVVAWARHRWSAEREPHRYYAIWRCRVPRPRQRQTWATLAAHQRPGPERLAGRSC